MQSVSNLLAKRASLRLRRAVLAFELGILMKVDDNYAFLRQVESPVTAKQLRPLDPRCDRVQFCTPLTEADFKKLAAFMKRYPNVALRFYRLFYRGSFSLEFLRFFPFLKRLAIDDYELQSFDGIEYAFPGLRELRISQTKSKRHSLRFLERFQRLRALSLEGHVKDIEVLASLSSLKKLTLRSITLPDLTVLTPLKSLKSLSIELGGTTNLKALPKIRRLECLRLFRIRGLADVRYLSDLVRLRLLFLQDLTRVSKLPSFKMLLELRRVKLDTLKSLHDLRPIAMAPALEELVAVGMPQLDVSSFRPFAGHPTLKRALIGLGSRRKNKPVEDLLKLPDAEYLGDVDWTAFAQ